MFFDGDALICLHQCSCAALAASVYLSGIYTWLIHPGAGSAKKCHVKDVAGFLCKLKKGNILFSWGLFPLGVPGKYRYCWQKLHRKHSSYLALSVVVFPLRGWTSHQRHKSRSPYNHCATVLTAASSGLAARSKKQSKVHTREQGL